MINHDQSARSIARCPSQPAAADVISANRTLSAASFSSVTRLATCSKLLPVGRMTSQDGGVERDSTKTSYLLGVQFFDGQYSVNARLPVASQGLSHGIMESTVELASIRRSMNASCTPHSIEDILGRPRQHHVTSLLLPESRRTSGSATQDRLYSWSSENVQRLDQRTGEEGATWKASYWTQGSTNTTTPSKRGTSTTTVLL